MIRKSLAVCFVMLLCTSAFAQRVGWEPYIQVRIRVDTPQGSFNDAIYLSPAEYQAFTVAQINAAVQKRVDNWVAIQEHPPVPVEPSISEYVEEIDSACERMSGVVEALIAKNPTKAQLVNVRDRLAQIATRLKDAYNVAP